MLTQTDRVLVFAAHADDEVLGCGGMLARLYRQGIETAVAIATRPSADPGNDVNFRYGGAADAAWMCRRGEAQLAAKILGVSLVDFYEYPEVYLDIQPLPPIVTQMRKTIGAFLPTVVFTHGWWDLNQDHRRVCEAALIAARLPHRTIRAVYAYGVEPAIWPAVLAPTFGVAVVGLTEMDLDVKCRAMSAYESEARESPDRRSLPVLRARALYDGQRAGFEYAEVFTLVWERRPTDG